MPASGLTDKWGRVSHRCMRINSTSLPGLLDFSRILHVPFSVKSDRTDALLQEVRKLTGEGVTEAVTRSLELRLRQLKHRPRPSGDRIMEIAKEFRDRFGIEPWKPGDPEFSREHGALLYDDGGVPK